MRSIKLCAVALIIGANPLVGLDLWSELHQQSVTRGLALASAVAGRVAIVPFGEPVGYFSVNHHFPSSAFSKEGQMVVWWWPNGFFDFRGEYAINSMDGRIVAQGYPTISGFSPVGLSEKGGRLAFWAQTPSATSSSLYWSSLDFSTIGLVASGTPYPDWSPDGSNLVYEQNGRICIYSLAIRRLPLWFQAGILLGVPTENIWLISGLMKRHH